MADEFWTDERAGFAVHIAAFFASLVIAAFLYILLEPAAETMLDTAGNQTTTSDAATGQSYVATMLGNAHLIVVGLGLLELVAAAVFRGRVD